MCYIVRSSLRLDSLSDYILWIICLGLLLFTTADIFVESTATMVNKCSAFGCKSGYKNKTGVQSEQPVTFHAYPVYDQDLCAKWTKANPRKGFVPSKHSKLCSLHFHPSDFVTERTDSNTARKNRKLAVSEQPLRRHLKPGAVPSIFPNAPSYLTMSKSSSRKTKCATSSSRHQQEAERLDVLEQSFTCQ